MSDRESDPTAPPTIACSRVAGRGIERIELAWWKGEDMTAQQGLDDALGDAIVSGDEQARRWVEMAYAHWCLVTDQEGRAWNHLQRVSLQWSERQSAPEFFAYGWLAHSRYCRITRKRGPDWLQEDVTDWLEKDNALAPAVWAEASVRLAKEGDLSGARHAAVEATDSAVTPSVCWVLALHARAQVEIILGLEDSAAEALEQAVRWCTDTGLRRLEARLLIRLALQVAPKLPGRLELSPAQLLGRASKLLGGSTTWRDRARLRQGYRDVGRRLQDKVLSGELAAKSDALENAIGQCVERLSAPVDDLSQALARLAAGSPRAEGLQRVREALAQTRRAIRDETQQMLHVAGAAVDQFRLDVVNRHRLRRLTEVFSRFAHTDTPESMAELAARLLQNLLEADVVVLAKESKQGGYEKLAWHGKHSSSIIKSDEVLTRRIRECLGMATEDAPPVSGRNTPIGKQMVVAWSTPRASGVVLASKEESGGRFTDQDVQLARTFTDMFELAFSRQLAISEKQVAIHELAATIDTIRDGVLALTSEGIVSEVNAAAERMLRLRRNEIVGKRLDQQSRLSPLWETLSSGQRLDGVVVRLAHGSFVVTARPFSQGQHVSGIVATLVELERARKLAHKLSTPAPRYAFSDIIGSSRVMREALNLARQASMVDASLLITGETGTGKEIFAQAIHTGGPRASEPFVGLNCAAVPRELLEAELFGYERGAFTGARAEGNPGKFEAAGRGTILLDEIGDMPLDMQAKLLRVLQERSVVRIGGSLERPVHARIIATTHRDLERYVREGRFRMDLYYRLRVLHIELPPLRERETDVLELARRFLQQFSRSQGKRLEKISPAIEEEFLRYRWPGNVRELANVMLREVSMAAPEQTELTSLQRPLEERQSWTNAFESPTAVSRITDPTSIRPLAEVEKEAFLHAYEACNHHVPSAARALGVSKVTFYKKLRAWGLHPKEQGSKSGATS